MTDTAESTYHLLEPYKRDYGTIRNFIDGEWVASETERHGDVIDPATGATIARVPMSTKAETDKAIKAAHDAFWEWRTTPPLVRSRYLFKIKELLDGHHEELARITSQENGKAIDEARGETLRSIENVETAAGITSLMMGYNLEDGAARNIDEAAVRQPLGVFACVTPFNFPGMVPFWFWPYALAAGDTFVVKVSERTPLTTLRTFEILQEADLPDGVLNLVHGDKEAVDAILDSPLVKGVTFVGSTPVARYIYARCGETGKRALCQAGAKNFVTVMPDAEVERAAGNLMSSYFGCAGQRCLAGANLMAVGGVYDELKAKFVEAASRLKVGPGLDESVNMGPVISAQSLERVRATSPPRSSRAPRCCSTVATSSCRAMRAATSSGRPCSTTSPPT